MLPFLSIIKRCLFEAEISSINRFMLSNLEPDLFSINSTLKTKQNKTKKTILVSCVRAFGYCEHAGEKLYGLLNGLSLTLL